MTIDYSGISLWMDGVDDDLTPRPALQGEVDADVAIVGAGYTGLWTAYYLLKADPSLRVAVLEKEIAGFGASGRNGGWCSALFAAPHKKIAARYGRDAAIAMQEEMFNTVDEVGRATAAEGIDCDYDKGGTLTLVTSPVQLGRVRAHLDDERSWGFGPDDYIWLDENQVKQRVNVSDCRGAVYTPHCARIHPAKLARGLARTVERLGATIYEQTAVERIEPRHAITGTGAVRAPIVVQATEGYSAHLPGQRRRLVPLYSLMIATDPLPADVWARIGWDRHETLHDGRHLLIYAQRTADGRIALGGRGAPYHFASRIDGEFERAEVQDALAQILVELFPEASDAQITHRWGGPLGVPRDWFSSVGLDRATGIAWAGGYVGDGVSTTNLAGRTLSDLITGRDSAVVKLPWVGHRSRSWEPEPFRWIGINGALKLMASADQKELRTKRPTRRGELVKALIGI